MTAAPTETHFEGWLCPDASAIEGKMEWGKYEPKKFTDDDIQMDITCCGICMSDLSTMSDGWGKAMRPLVTGHEIVGKVTHVGKNVQGVKVGDRMGVGAQSDSCLSCSACKADEEPYCKNGIVGTYNGKFKNGSGPSFGGYAQKWRGPAHFAVKIPDGLEDKIAAPLMCGGITIFSPLHRYGTGSKDVKRVGIVGVGGIGAFGIAFAKALGADTVVAIGHSPSKKDAAFKLGATDYVSTSDNSDALLEKYGKDLDLIVNTANHTSQDYASLIKCLRPRGHLINIAIPHGPVCPIPVGALIGTGAAVGGSCVGGPKEIEYMLNLAAEKKPVFMIEERKMSEANQAVVDMEANKARFRYVLTH